MSPEERLTTLYELAYVWLRTERPLHHPRGPAPALRPLVLAACDALAEGFEGAALQALAGVSVAAADHDRETEELVEAALAEQGRPLPPRGVLDPLIGDALAPVMRDLAATCEGSLEVRAVEWIGEPDWISAYLDSDDGSGTGISIARWMTYEERVARLADQVQDIVIEGGWSATVWSLWPECDEHPGTHPLVVACDDGRALWRCPKSGRSVATVGMLVSSDCPQPEHD